MKSSLVQLSVGLVASVVLLPGAALAKSPASTKNSVAPRSVELVHSLDSERSAVLQSLVDQFNGLGKDKITLSARPLNADALPTMMIVDKDTAQGLLGGKPRIAPLYDVVRKGGGALTAMQAPAYMDPVFSDSKGRLRGLPVGLSTPVLYANKAELALAGVDADQLPRTWGGMQEVIGRLVDNGAQCPYTVSEPARVMIDNLGSWHNQASVGMHGKTSELSFNGMLQIKHLALMASWYRANYLRVFNTEDEAEGHFASGDCAMVIAPSSEWPRFSRAGFPLTVAPLPYHDDVPGAPQNTVAEGLALWVAAGRATADYKVVARFVDFWLRPENQKLWEEKAGFLPLSPVGKLLSASSVAPDELPVKVAVAQLSDRPATVNSRAGSSLSNSKVRAIIEEELAGVWADTIPAKQALDTAVERAQKLR